ncbi:MAG: hypothetical protein JSS76_07475 [Bacteroidetes bacterium]|nr:hypothetical protein [Bacteroidota bacterium]
MTIDEINRLELVVQQLEQISIEETLRQFRSNLKDDDILLENFTKQKIVNTFNKTVHNFRGILNDNYVLFLPGPFHAGVNNHNIINDLSGLNSSLRGNDMTGAAVNLRFTVDYQILYNFWDRYESINLRTDLTQIENYRDRLQVIYNQVQKDNAQYKSVLTLFEEFKKDLNTLISNSRIDFETISNNKTVSENYRNELTTLKTESEVNKDAIATIRNEQGLLLEDMRLKENELGNLVKTLTESQSKYNLAIDAINKDVEYILGKKNEIDNLTGQAADGALGHTFNKRTADLKKNSQTWMWAVIFSGVVLVIWLFVIFYFLAPQSGNVWLDFLINIARSSPGWLLIGFCISQYTKERNLEEEYAFKAAVAMTISAYTDKLGSGKDEMLRESTQKVYELPSSLIDKHKTPESLIPKNLAETIKALGEAIKSAKA